MSESSQLIIAMLSGNVALVGALCFIAKKFGPGLFEWMKSKIDTKNGEISQLVAQTKTLAEDISRMTKLMCTQIEQGTAAQATVLDQLREVCERKDGQIDRLIEQIREAIERAA